MPRWPRPWRSHGKLNGLPCDEALLTGRRGRISYKVVSRLDRYCQIVADPPAVPLWELVRTYARTDSPKTVFRNSSANGVSRERRKMLEFLLNIPHGHTGRFSILAVIDVAVECVTRRQDSLKALTPTNWRASSCEVLPYAPVSCYEGLYGG